MKVSRKFPCLFAAMVSFAAQAATVEVHMKSEGAKMHFVPDVVTIKKGDKVKWINDDARKQFHTVTSGKAGKPDRLFDSKMMASGKTFERVFTEAGEFDYYCIPHVAMKMFGKVVVK